MCINVFMCTCLYTYKHKYYLLLIFIFWLKEALVLREDPQENIKDEFPEMILGFWNSFLYLILFKDIIDLDSNSERMLLIYGKNWQWSFSIYHIFYISIQILTQCKDLSNQ